MQLTIFTHISLMSFHLNLSIKAFIRTESLDTIVVFWNGTLYLVKYARIFRFPFYLARIHLILKHVSTDFARGKISISTLLLRNL